MSIWKTPDQKPKQEELVAWEDINGIHAGRFDTCYNCFCTCADYRADLRKVKKWCSLENLEYLIAQADKAERLQKAVEWLVGGDTGISSKTMCAALFGAGPKYSDMPHDADDFGRCLRFIRFMPDGTKDIVFKKISDKPEWVEIGKRWDEMVDLYDQKNWAGIGDILRAIHKEYRQPRPNEIFIGL